MIQTTKPMARTLEEGFNKFLEWLEPLTSEHDKSISHKNSVKSCLVKNFKCSNFFETGSFGNGTGIRHYSDTDYFAVCAPEALTKNSAYTLRKVKECLQGTFWKTQNIEVNSPSITIPFGKYASENLEITPCFYYKLSETPLGRKKSYAIANGLGGWMLSSPQAHNAYVESLNKGLSGKLKPLIRLVKAWKFYNSVPITSFYLELRVAKFAEKKKSITYDLDLFRIIKRLNDLQLANIQDPMKVSGYVNACVSETKKETALSKLKTAQSRAFKACLVRERDLDKAFYWWKMFFKNKFPSR